MAHGKKIKITVFGKKKEEKKFKLDPSVKKAAGKAAAATKMKRKIKVKKK